MRMSYSTAKKILEDALENFTNLKEIHVDFMGRFIRRSKNRREIRQSYDGRKVTLQMGYKQKDSRFANLNILDGGSDLGDFSEIE